MSGGRDIGVVFNHKQPGGVTVLPASGDVGAQFTPAVGWAQAVQYHVESMGEEEYRGAVGLAHAGDGATSTNGFWSAINIAAQHRLPYIMLIEDNQYALSVPWRYQSAAPSVVDNLAKFQGIRIQSVEGGEIEALYEVIQSAIAGARKGEGPQLIHVKVPRLTGHNWQDPAAYKSAEEKAEEVRRDPLARLITWLEDERGVSAAQIAEMTEQAAAFALEQGEAAWTQGHEPQGRLTAIKVMAHYLRVAFWPVRLSSDYSYSEVSLASGSLGDWGAWLTVAGALALMGILYFRNRSSFFFAGFALVNFSIVSNILFPIGTIMAERLLYLPLAGLVAAAVIAIDHAGRVVRVPAAVPVLLAGLLASGLMARTWIRNRDWQDDLTDRPPPALRRVQEVLRSTACWRRLSLSAIRPMATLTGWLPKPTAAWRF